MSLFRWIGPAAGGGAISDHDRVVVLEERLQQLAKLLDQFERRILEQLAETDSRLNEGNKVFRDWDVFRERTTEELASLRNKTGSAQLAADQAGRGLLDLGRNIDTRAQTADERRALLADTLRQEFRADLKDVRQQLSGLEDTVQTWKTQMGVLVKVVGPAVAIAMSIISTLIFRWLGL